MPSRLKEDLTGKRFGMLTVIERAPNSAAGKPMWRCKCDCGNETVVHGNALRDGYTKSCGCYRREIGRAKNLTHGGSKDRLYATWNMIKQRCNDPANKSYKNYGGRGIKVCSEWNNDYEAFKTWALQNGYDPNAKRKECTIDRINNDKGYSPDNCRWVDSITQANNCRSNHNLAFQGKTQTISQWARQQKIPAQTILFRINRAGWNVEDALTIPPVIGRNQTWRKEA